MLAQLATRLPEGPLWRYEPKLDGFRGLLWRSSASHLQLLSRNARDLAPWFPELVRAAGALPVNTLIDGEIVICDDAGWVDFGALQQRLSPLSGYMCGGDTRFHGVRRRGAECQAASLKPRWSSS